MGSALVESYLVQQLLNSLIFFIGRRGFICYWCLVLLIVVLLCVSTRLCFLACVEFMYKESPVFNMWHSLFKFSDPSKDGDGPEKNVRVFGYSWNWGKALMELQLFNFFQEHCHKWKKIKVLKEKEALVSFYSIRENKYTWWAPEVTAKHQLMEGHLPLAIVLLGRLVWLANSGCSYFEMWKAAGDTAGLSSPEVVEDDMVLI